jgi:hypothetical protein
VASHTRAVCILVQWSPDELVTAVHLQYRPRAACRALSPPACGSAPSPPATAGRWYNRAASRITWPLWPVRSEAATAASHLPQGNQPRGDRHPLLA